MSSDQYSVHTIIKLISIKPQKILEIYNFYNFLLLNMQTSIENLDFIDLKKKSRTVSTFLKKTFQLLNEPESNSCIKWTPNGIGFIVINEELFSKTVLPKYFKHCNYSSFVRQLNMYNFHKIRETNSQSYFHHECFDRDNKNAMSEIRRKSQKKKSRNQDIMDDRFQNQSFPTRHRSSKDDSQRRQNESRMYSEERVSISLLKQENQEPVKSQKNTRIQLFSETSYYPQPQINQDQKQKIRDQQIEDQQFNSLTSQKNILSVQDDDLLSIDDEISEAFPRFKTRELFYPSTNNLFPFVGSIQPSTHSLFF